MTEGGIDGRVARLEKDVYFGNGKPALTVRMQQCEDSHDDLKESTDATVSSLREVVLQIRGDMRKVVWLVLTAVVLAVLKLIFVKG